MLERIQKLCGTKLDSRNMTQVINEYAISLLNYHIALVDYTEDEFNALDLKVRTELRKHQHHYKLQCLERLYLPRKENG